MKLRIEAAAEAETREAAEWYERQRLGLGLEFLVAVDVAIQQICLSPERSPRLETVPEEESVRRHLKVGIAKRDRRHEQTLVDECRRVLRCEQCAAAHGSRQARQPHETA